MALKENLQMAQNRHKKYYDQNQTKRVFEVGDMVYFRLQPFWQSSLKKRRVEKLQPRYFRPYNILRRVGEVAYELELPCFTPKKGRCTTGCLFHYFTPTWWWRTIGFDSWEGARNQNQEVEIQTDSRVLDQMEGLTRGWLYMGRGRDTCTSCVELFEVKQFWEGRLCDVPLATL